MSTTRRDALRLAALGTVGLAACKDGTSTPADDSAPDTTDDSAAVTPDCVLSPSQVAGPFYFDVDQIRTDIREDKEGVLLEASVVVIDAETCEPIRDAVVDFWHCDVIGAYSGYTGQGQSGDQDTTGETFLRGLQITDTDGKATFTTIFPGWYPGRAVHVHVKIHLDNNTLITTQGYFPNETNNAVHEVAPYSDSGPPQVTNETDTTKGDIDVEESGLLFRVTGDVETGLQAEVTLGVAQD